jgi:hypothetical protein
MVSRFGLLVQEKAVAHGSTSAKLTPSTIDAHGTVRKIRVGELSRPVVEAEVQAIPP